MKFNVYLIIFLAFLFLSSFTSAVTWTPSGDIDLYNYYTIINGTNATFNDVVTANSFVGDGSGLTNTSLSNETAAINALNASKLNISDQRYNDTAAIILKLNISDQRYNDTVLIQAVNTTANVEVLGFVTGAHTVNTDTQWDLNASVLRNESGTLGIVRGWWDNIYSTLADTFSRSVIVANFLNISDQRYNNTAAIALKLDITDQRYNDTSAIDLKLDITDQRYNNSAAVDLKHTPGTCAAGYAIQNTTTGGVQCIALIPDTDSNSFWPINTSALRNESGTLGVLMSLWDSLFSPISLVTTVSDLDTKTDNNNDTLKAEIDLKLPITDQRYNDTSIVDTLETKVDANNVTLKAEIDLKLDISDQRYNDSVAVDLKLDISDQRYNDTVLINANNISNNAYIATKLDITDQRYNDSAAVALKHTPGVCSAGYAVQNTTTGGVECVLMPVDTDTNSFWPINTSALRNESGTLGVLMSLWDALFAPISLVTTVSDLDTLVDNNNDTLKAEIDLKLDLTDQRYNETTALNNEITLQASNNVTQAGQISSVVSDLSNEVTLQSANNVTQAGQISTEVALQAANNVTQAGQISSVVSDLNDEVTLQANNNVTQAAEIALKLDITDQRYNESSDLDTEVTLQAANNVTQAGQISSLVSDLSDEVSLQSANNVTQASQISTEVALQLANNNTQASQISTEVALQAANNVTQASQISTEVALQAANNVTQATAIGLKISSSEEGDLNVNSSSTSTLAASATSWDGETSQSNLNVNHSTTADTATTWDSETSQANLNVNSSNTANSATTWDSETSQANLNVNSSNNWDSLNTPGEILISDLDQSGETSLNVNSSDKWDSLNTPSDILISDLDQTGETSLNVNSSNWWALLSSWSSTMFENVAGELGIKSSWFNSSVDARIDVAEPSLNVNSSAYWDGLNTPGDILISDLNQTGEADLNVNSSTTATSAATATSWDSETSQANLNVNSSNNWDGLNTPANILISDLDQSGETSLNVNSSDNWDGLNTPSDIGTNDITDDGTWIVVGEEPNLNVNHSVTSDSATSWDGETSQSNLNVNSSNYWDSETSQANLNVNYSDNAGSAVATSDSTWTLHNDFPTTCSGGTPNVQAIGDTLTCRADTDTTYSAASPVNQTGTIFGITADSIDDSHLAFNTGQSLTVNSNVTFKRLNVSNGTMFMGDTEGSQFTYYYEAGTYSEYFGWWDSVDTFYFSDAISAGGGIITTSTITGGLINSNGDLWTTGAGDDFWLGTVTQGNAAFRAYADGNLVATVTNVTTLDTGQGANELYGMDQDVLAASDVNFNDVTAAGSLRLPLNFSIFFGDSNDYCIFHNGTSLVLNNNESGVTCPTG